MTKEFFCSSCFRHKKIQLKVKNINGKFVCVTCNDKAIKYSSKEGQKETLRRGKKVAKQYINRDIRDVVKYLSK